MTRGPWKYKKAQGHHHVLFPNGEVLDVQNEFDARLISLVPEMVELILLFEKLGWGHLPGLNKKLRKYK